MPIPGLETTYTECASGARVFSYHKISNTDSKLPVLVLLHGYPQNSLMFKEFVKEIPPQWSVLVPDLPGYGNSTKPISPADSPRAHSKREWAKDIVDVVDAVYGPDTKFIAYGHDRGARLAYRLALDFPRRVVGAGLLDIVPTSYVWDAMRLEKGHVETKRTHHWIFLSAPRPLPETMIASNPKFYFEYTLLGWTGPAMKDASLEWVKDSIEPYFQPDKGKDRIAAACEDYRAGATLDVDDDLVSSIDPLSASAPASPPFSCPLLILSSHHLRRRFDVDAIWTALSTPGTVRSFQVGDETIGHFIVNEKQEETAARTREWLAQFFEGK